MDEKKPPETFTLLTATDVEGAKNGVKRNGEKVDSSKSDMKTNLLYSINDTPPWYLSIILAFQHYLVFFCPTIPTPFLIATAMCIDVNDPVRANLISTILFVSGITSLVQLNFGVRLPLLQGGSNSFLVPAFVILALPQWRCPDPKATAGELSGGAGFFPNSSMTFTSHDVEITWEDRMREIQGAIIVASLAEIVIGYTGLIGILLRFISPLVVGPTVALIGLSMFRQAANLCSKHWPIAGLTIILLLLFVQYMSELQVPILVYNKLKGFHFIRLQVFKMFPVVIAMFTVWILCAILSATGAIDEKSEARTDSKLNIISDSPWFSVPYPGQWGLPTVSVAAVLGMLTAVIVSTIESVGDYYICARVSGAPPPPVHAINRGIGTEGMGVLLAGLFGTGCGTTSYSQNIAAITLTRVGSRQVIQITAGFLVFFGVFTKFGALFATVPLPIVGGMFCVMSAMIASVGLSNLQFVDLNSPRNLMILGFSLFFGLTLPHWTLSNMDNIKTGNIVLDQVLAIFLGTSMFVGMICGLILDNTVPGTPEERGLIGWHHNPASKQCENTQRVYNFPYGMEAIRKIDFLRYIPCFPTFAGFQRGNKTADDRQNGSLNKKPNEPPQSPA